MTVKKGKRKAPVTTTFVKDIVTEGTYHVTGPDGKLVKVNVPRSRLEKMVETGKKLLEKGFKIPAPWKHDPKVIIGKIQEGDNGLLSDSTVNGGFWTSLVGKINEEGKYQVSGTIEVPGKEDDHNSPAGKVGTTVQETSIYLKPKHKLSDESGEVLEEVPMHIALVTHSIEPGQKNFEILDGELTIAMSQLVTDSEEFEDQKPEVDPNAEGLLSEATELLSSVAKIFVPKSATIADFLTHLVTSLNQMKLCMKDGSGNGSDQSSQTFTVEPIVMAKLSPEQIEALLGGKPNPATGKPFTKEDLADKEPAKSSEEESKMETMMSQMNLMMSQMANQLSESNRANYRNRVQSLIERGVLSADHAKDKIYPLVEAYQSSKPESGSALETILMSLEGIPSPDSLVEKMLAGGTVYEVPGEGAEDSKFQDDVANELAGMI